MFKKRRERKRKEKIKDKKETHAQFSNMRLSWV